MNFEELVMADQSHTAGRVVGSIVVAASNVGGWLSSVDAGAMASLITFGGGAVVGVYVLGIKQIAKARTDARAEEFRSNLQLRKEQEEAERGSLTVEVTRLREAITTMECQWKQDVLERDHEIQESRHEVKRLLDLLTRSSLSQGVRLHEEKEAAAFAQAQLKITDQRGGES